MQLITSKVSKTLEDQKTLLIGTGEYTTGWTNQGGVKSDKSCGVVGLVFFDLRERKKVNNQIKICGTNGKKFSGIRKHLKINIENVYGLSTSFQAFPPREEVDFKAYKKAIQLMEPGDLAVIFTPDDTHYNIALECLQNGLNVLLTKPIVKTLAEHKELVRIAWQNNVLLQVEVHKRFDPFYRDARSRIQKLGDFNYYSSYMSQPTKQLKTFRTWAGKSSDISYYLNSHHVDFHVWAMRNLARPRTVTALASNGISKEFLGRSCEDTITLTVQWESLYSSNTGIGVYTASWTSGDADVHSQQSFFYLSSKGELKCDQAHRGYTMSNNNPGCFKSVNPLFFRYTPDEKGKYAGHSCYGHITFEKFVDAVYRIRNSRIKLTDFDLSLPTGYSTLLITAILEAGRISLDNKNLQVNLNYDENGIISGFQK